jgi:hypothetical protein
MFVALFYISVLPTGLLFSVFGLIVRFYVDKHGLLRRWAQMPQLGIEMAMSSIGLLKCSIVVAVITANRFFGRWPFDNVCAVPAATKPLNHSGFEFCVSPESALTCNFIGVFCYHAPNTDGLADNEQQLLARVFVWLTVGVLSIQAAYAAFYGSMWSVRAMFYGIKHEPSSEPSIKKYTTLDEIQAFVPQIKFKGLSTNLIACDISLFDHEYIDWAGHFDEYNIFLDAKADLEELDPSKVAEMSGTLFSICRIFPTAANPDPLKKLDAGDSGLGMMWVNVVSASGLISGDSNGTSDPFAKVFFGGMSWATSVVHKSLTPHWDEVFRVPISEIPGSASGNVAGKLEICVRDHDTSGWYDHLGTAHFDVADVITECEHLLGHLHAIGKHTDDEGGYNDHDGLRKECDLLEVEHGKLTVQFVWVPNAERRKEIYKQSTGPLQFPPPREKSSDGGGGSPTVVSSLRLKVTPTIPIREILKSKRRACGSERDDEQQEQEQEQEHEQEVQEVQEVHEEERQESREEGSDTDSTESSAAESSTANDTGAEDTEAEDTDGEDTEYADRGDANGERDLTDLEEGGVTPDLTGLKFHV